MEHLRQGGGGRVNVGEQAGPVFDRCALLLEPATSNALHNHAGLFRLPAEPSEYLITWAEHVPTGVRRG